ncbi:MAG TPA: cytochrome c [Solirubrobacteraceae bacterium]
MSCPRAVLIGALVLALSGCGASGGPRSGSVTGAQSGAIAAGPASGHEVFTRACSFCHSLTGHSSPKQQGGDLLGARLRRPVLVQFTAEMPVKHRLTKAELNAVVDYVLAVQRGSR